MRTPLTIAVLNDLHVGGAQDSGFQNSFLTADASKIVGPTVEMLNGLDTDLVLIPGDLTQDATPAQLDLVMRCLNGLQAPYVVCKGNHDRETPTAAARFDAALGRSARPGVTHGPQFGLPESLAILVLEASWKRDGQTYAADDPPLAVIDTGLIEQALEDLDVLKPQLLLVVCHYPLVSQAEYVTSVCGRYAGHVDGGRQLLDELTARAQTVLCFTGHNHYHHIVSGDRWLQCGTGALAEYPAEFRVVTIEGNQVRVSSATAAQEVLDAGPQPEHRWVAGRPQDREITWQAG